MRYGTGQRGGVYLQRFEIGDISFEDMDIRASQCRDSRRSLPVSHNREDDILGGLAQLADELELFEDPDYLRARMIERWKLTPIPREAPVIAKEGMIRAGC